jgi:hypothetical protein
LNLLERDGGGWRCEPVEEEGGNSNKVEEERGETVQRHRSEGRNGREDGVIELGEFDTRKTFGETVEKLEVVRDATDGRRRTLRVIFHRVLRRERSAEAEGAECRRVSGERTSSVDEWSERGERRVEGPQGGAETDELVLFNIGEDARLDESGSLEDWRRRRGWVERGREREEEGGRTHGPHVRSQYRAYPQRLQQLLALGRAVHHELPPSESPAHSKHLISSPLILLVLPSCCFESRTGTYLAATPTALHTSWSRSRCRWFVWDEPEREWSKIKSSSSGARERSVGGVEWVIGSGGGCVRLVK